MEGIYIGSIEHLRGEKAILRQPPEESHVLAQFHDRTLRSGTPVRIDDTKPMMSVPADALGFGWHVFRLADFEIVKEAPPIVTYVAGNDT